MFVMTTRNRRLGCILLILRLLPTVNKILIGKFYFSAFCGHMYYSYAGGL